MSARRSLAYAASGIGAAAVAALATGVVVERRVVRNVARARPRPTGSVRCTHRGAR